MSYRFVKVTTFYRDFLRQYYKNNPAIADKTYAEQLQHLMSQGYGWADFYSRHLRTLGVESHEIVYNAEPLQRAWARQHGVDGSLKDILIAQLKEMRPDVIFFQESFKLNGEWVSKLREEVPSIKQVIGYCCAPFSQENVEQFRAFDYMIVCSPGFLRQFLKYSLRAYLVYHCFEASMLPLLEKDNQYPVVDFLFAGSIVPGSDFHVTRQQVLQHLIESDVRLSIRANIVAATKPQLLMRQIAYLVAKMLKQIGLGMLARSLPFISKAHALTEMPRNLKGIKLIQQIAEPPLFGIEMLKALSKAKISFNVHGDVAGNFAANVRLFEITGVGSCLLTDWKENLSEIFEIDSEVVTYKSPGECVEKVRWLLDHDRDRNSIAKRGQARTLRDHNFSVRAAQLNEIILENF